jgi:hypothetical protein
MALKSKGVICTGSILSGHAFLDLEATDNVSESWSVEK